MAEKDVKETRQYKASYRQFEHKGKQYVQDKKTYELYLREDYEKAKKEKTLLNHPVGKVVYKGKQENVLLY